MNPIFASFVNIVGTFAFGGVCGRMGRVKGLPYVRIRRKSNEEGSMELEDLKRAAKSIINDAIRCVGGDGCYLCNRRAPDCAETTRRRLRALNEAMQEYQRPAVKVKAVKRSKAVRKDMEKL